MVEEEVVEGTGRILFGFSPPLDLGLVDEAWEAMMVVELQNDIGDS
jgi:hypothetical protein